MITIPITIIATFIGVTLIGVILGLVFTGVFMFGCDNKYFNQNAIISVLITWVVVIGKALTDAGVIIWK